MSDYLNNPHDHFFKELLARPEHVAAFLEASLPADILALLDVSQPEPVKDSFVDESLRDQHSDLLYRVKRQADAGAAYVYILFEHKSVPDEWVAWQLLRYLVRLWELLLRHGAEKLPPVFPLVFYHGERRWQVPAEFSALLELEQAAPLRAFLPEFRYHLCDLSVYDATRIKGAAFLCAGLRLLQTIFTDKFEEALAEALDLLLRVPEPSTMEYLQKLLRYAAGTRKGLKRARLRQIVNTSFAKTQEVTVMSTLAQEWIEEGIQQGIQQGVQQGIQQARSDIEQTMAEHALTLLEMRFGRPDTTIERRVRALAFEQLMDLMVVAHSFNSSADLLGWLNQQAGSVPADDAPPIN